MTEIDYYQSYKQEVYDINNGEDNLELLFWCIDKNNEPVLLRVINYYYSFYFIADDLDLLSTKIQEDTRFSENDNNVSISSCRKKYIYYYDEDVHDMKYMTFTCKSDKEYFLKKIKFGYTVKKKKIKGEIFEENDNLIPPYLKLYAELNFSPANWFNCETIKIKKECKISNINEYYVDWKTISKSENINFMSRPMTMSYDIECYSSNYKVFPEKSKNECQITMIACTFENLGDVTTRKSSLLYIGDNDLTVDDVDLYPCDTEKHLLTQFFKIIRQKNVILLTGYNIGHFDNEYIYHRALINNLKVKIPSLLKTPISNIYFKSNENSSFVNKAGSTNFIFDGRISIDVFDYMKRIYGGMKRHTLDFVSKKLLNGKKKHDVTPKEMFESYEKYRSHQIKNGFVPESKHMDNEKRWFEDDYKLVCTYEEAVEEYTRLAKYCVQDTHLPLDLMKKTNTWTSQLEMSKQFNVDIEKLSSNGEQIKCFSQLYVLFARDNRVLKREFFEEMFANGGLVTRPRGGIHEECICLDFASLYPSAMRAFNICYTTLVKDSDVASGKYNLKDLLVVEYEQEEPTKDSKGKLPTKKDKAYKEGLHIVKYKRYYIKREIHEGILPKLMAKLRQDRVNIKNKESLLIDEIDDLSKKIIELRKDDKPENDSEIKRMENIISNNTIMSGIYNAQQSAMKVSMNSIYGFLKVNKGAKMSFPHLAQSITAMGRQCILKCNSILSDDLRKLFKPLIGFDKGEHSPNEMIPKLFMKDGKATFPDLLRKYDIFNTNRSGIVCYNDTDSVYIKFPWLDPKDVYTFGLLLQYAFSYVFDKTLILEYEQCLKRVIFVTKKRYIGIVMDNSTGENKKDKNNKNVMYAKGLVTAKNSAMDVQRIMLSELSEKALEGGKFIDCLELVFKHVKKILDPNLPVNDVMQCNKIKKHYSQDSYTFAIFGKNLIKRNKPFEDKEAIDYTFCYTQDSFDLLKAGKNRFGGKVKSGNTLYSLQEIEEKSAPPIDKISIITKISESIDQMFYACFNGYEFARSINIRRGRTDINLSTPVKYISAFLSVIEQKIAEDADNIEEMIKIINNNYEEVIDFRLEAITEELNKSIKDNKYAINDDWLNGDDEDDDGDEDDDIE